MVKPVWNNAQRVNHQNFAKNTHPYAKKKLVPRAVLMKSDLVSVNTARQVITAHLKTTVNAARPMSYLSKIAHSTTKRPIHKNTTFKNSNIDQRVNTVSGKKINTARPKAVVNVVKGNNVNAVKASACWVWKPKTKVLDHGNPQMDLQDQGVIDSGCSRHMTGNMSYLTDYEEIDGGYVAFGGNPKGGKITGKGTIKTGNLDFENVYFVRELKFNLFSVSQMCDKKNSVLFNDTECIVLSPNFKLIDESQVLLRVPRKNNMYSVDLKNIVPKGGLTCLFAKATSDESKLWHRRLDDFSRFTWVFFLATKDETSGILKSFITGIENLVDHKADINNLDTIIQVSPIPTTRIHKDHPLDQVIGDLQSATQTRRMSKNLEEHGFVSTLQQKPNHKDLQNCLFACFLSQEELKKVIYALKDLSWIDAMQEELLQFKLQEVWTLVDLPIGKRDIGSKWVFRNKKVERGIVIRNKVRLVAQGYTQEEGIDYDEVFTLVYVCQPPGFEDPDFSDRVYKVEKALYGLHKAPRAWYETLSTYLFDNEFQRGKIDKTLFIKRIKDASTPIETQKLKDEDGKEVDVHMYRYQVNPKVSHLYAVKRMFRYLKGQPKLGLWYPKNSPFDLVAYTDSDYARQVRIRNLQQEVVQFLDVIISWQVARKQTVCANSTTEAEYMAALSCYGQATVKVKTVNGEVQLHALVDGKKIIITESTVRRDLQLEDVKGIDCLPNSTIFEQLTLMGYEKIS
ncbi:putative ribonuclease H-like domain-containing protein [Tanacetum coccineum]